MRKEIVVYSACQGESVARVMQENPVFNEEYVVSNMIRNYWFIRDNKPVMGSMQDAISIKNADVFIYQPLSDKHGENSTNHILQYLKPDCETITIPRLSVTWLYPFFVSYKRDLSVEWDISSETEAVLYVEPIKKLRDDGASNEDILKLFDENKIDWNFDVRKEREMNFIRQKEKNTTIKVGDYIETNFRTRRLFVYYTHPAANLFVHMADQVLSFLELPPTVGEFTDNQFNRCGGHGGHEIILSHPMTMPTATIKHFGLEYETDEGARECDKYYKGRLMDYLKGVYGS